MFKSILSLFLLFTFCSLLSQDILPPVMAWKGKSLELVSKPDNAWITLAERTDFQQTPSYDETMAWLNRLCQQSNFFRMVSIGTSANGRNINMVIGSADNAFDQVALQKSAKPLLLIQAGIHAGEIDGKDAGMMLLRDIAFGKKAHLLRKANILFIPILNVDGHERVSPHNRINQRGPSNMGWRTNARNLNLNRDYTKLDTEEINAVVSVMNMYDPDLYLDLHVTDGADYQYDITYGFDESGRYSPAIAKWLKEKLKPHADKQLSINGHIPGPLVFASNDRDFSEGMSEWPYTPRFSESYATLRHVTAVLVENHSLKPFRQRVLGTYIFLEAVIDLLGTEGSSLRSSIEADRNARRDKVVLSVKKSEAAEKIRFLGIESRVQKSDITGHDFVQWTGKPVASEISYIRYQEPDAVIRRPRTYWVPSTHKDVIEKLKKHGIAMEILEAPREVSVTMYRITDYKFSRAPFEGRMTVSARTTPEVRKEMYYPGSAIVTTDQPLGDLVSFLLEPESEDSFFSWGYFYGIFSRTEYAEQYVMEPLAKQMLAKDDKLRAAFELKMKNDAEFARNPHMIYQWFYARSPYYDERWLLYPVGLEY